MSAPQVPSRSVGMDIAQEVSAMFRKPKVLAGLVLWLAPGATCLGAVYVDASAPGPVHDGASWARAYRTITQALDAAPVAAEVWVRTGTYHERLSLSKHVSLYGGFLGCETAISQRLVGAFPTVIDAGGMGRGIDAMREQFVIIDGFTIRSGKADYGGGIRCETNADVKIRNCRIENCEATVMGGGLYFGKYATGEMTDSVIVGCTAPRGGGAVIEYHCYPITRRNVIIRNTATISGGGVYCPFHSGANLENCTLAYNTAEVNGGAVYAYYGGPVQLNYCIVAYNAAPVAGGIFGDGGSSQATLTGNDWWQNSGGDFGGWIVPPPPYLGNFAADPLFLMPDYDEYHLSVGSPCAGVGAFPLESVYRLDRIGLAKMLPDGAAVNLTGKIVSCVDGGAAFIQDHDRSAGIAVVGLSGYQPRDVLASVEGTISSNARGEKVLLATSASLHVRNVYQLKPLGVRVSMLGGASCLYARTWGRAENVTPEGFDLSDGAGSVRVRWAGTVAEGQHVVATGVYTAEGDFLAVDVGQ